MEIQRLSGLAADKQQALTAFVQHGFRSWPGATALQQMDEGQGLVLMRQLEDLVLTGSPA